MYSEQHPISRRYGTVERQTAIGVTEERLMFAVKQFRKKAAESTEALKHTDVPSEIHELQRSEQSFTELAQNETWLADSFDKMIRSRGLDAQGGAAGNPLDRNAVAEIEEHILRCLGAAVIMQWNTIPRKLQRELFDTAGSLGDVQQTTVLRGQIARFLHDHKDEESSADWSSGSNMTEGKPDRA
jgi:hypothetical protein